MKCKLTYLRRTIVILTLGCCLLVSTGCDYWDWKDTEDAFAEAALAATGDWAEDSLAAILNAMFPIADSLSKP